MLQVPSGSGEEGFGLSCGTGAAQPRGAALPGSELFSVHTAWPPSLASKPADRAKQAGIVWKSRLKQVRASPLLLWALPEWGNSFRSCSSPPSCSDGVRGWGSSRPQPQHPRGGLGAPGVWVQGWKGLSLPLFSLKFGMSWRVVLGSRVSPCESWTSHRGDISPGWPPAGPQGGLRQPQSTPSMCGPSLLLAGTKQTFWGVSGSQGRRVRPIHH